MNVNKDIKINLEINLPFLSEDRINFETAKLAKEKGFHWYSLFTKPDFGILCYTTDPAGNLCYNEEGKEIRPKYYNYKNNHYPRPTQALLKKWLREQHKIDVEVKVYTRPHYCVSIVDQFSNVKNIFFEDHSEAFFTYEEALEEGLKQALLLIK